MIRRYDYVEVMMLCIMLLNGLEGTDDTLRGHIDEYHRDNERV